MSGAPPPPVATAGRFEVGDVLARSISVWMKNFVPFSLLSLILHAPLILLLFVSLTGDLSLESPYFKYSGALNMIVSSLLTGAVVYGVVNQLRGRPVTLGQSVSVGLGRMFPVIGVALVVGIGVGLGFVLLIVPGVILLLMWWVAVPVAVVERPGVFASMGRSSDLTKGYKGQIFLLLLVFLAISLGLGLLLTGLFLVTPTGDSIRTYLVVMMAITVFVSAPFTAVMEAVSYQTLRTVKEGTSVEDLAKVFD